VDRGAALVEARHVHLQRERAPASGLDLAHQFAAAGLVAEAQRHIGARIGERERDGAPEPAAGACHQRGASGQIERAHFTSSQAPDFSLRKIASRIRICWIASSTPYASGSSPSTARAKASASSVY